MRFGMHPVNGMCFYLSSCCFMFLLSLPAVSTCPRSPDRGCCKSPLYCISHQIDLHQTQRLCSVWCPSVFTGRRLWLVDYTKLTTVTLLVINDVSAGTCISISACWASPYISQTKERPVGEIKSLTTRALSNLRNLRTKELSQCSKCQANCNSSYCPSPNFPFWIEVATGNKTNINNS